MDGKMKKILAVLLLSALPVMAQSNSVYNATTYAYTTQVTSGNAATGSSSIGAQPTAFAQGIPFSPYNTNASVTINRNGANAETVTPTAVANCYPGSVTCALSASFSNKHISGESIQSGTFGLQEALNVAIAAGSGTVLIDASWQGPSGSSLITAAAGSNNVVIQDNRNPTGPTFYQWNGSAYAVSGSGGSSSVPVTVVAASGSTQTIAFASSGNIAYDITLSANCTFTITAPANTGTYRTLTLVIRPASFQATLPASSGALAWSGGSAPTPSTTAVTVITFGSTGIAPVFGGL